MTATKAYSFTFSPSPLKFLSQIAQATSQVTQQLQISQIQHSLQQQLDRKIAALQPPIDQVSINYSQGQINNLQAQQNALGKIQTIYGNNGLIFSDLIDQLTTLASAATAGDAVAFDAALDSANTDINNLGIANFNPIFQNDGVASLKANGLAIQTSATYDLSTPAGQSAASADVSAAQDLINISFKATSGNQIVGTSELNSLGGRISGLQSLLDNQQQANSFEIASETAKLTQNMQNQLHIIMLNIGKSGQISQALGKMMTPPQQHDKPSLYGSLQNQIGQTAKNAQFQLNTNPAIMTLFA